MGALVRRPLEDLLRQFGYHVVPDNMVYEWQKGATAAGDRAEAALPAGAQEYLRRDNPRLAELQKAYASVAAPVTAAAVWTADYVRDEDLLFFRADNPFVYQLRGRNMNEMSYALTYYYTKDRDHLGLFSRLEEDQLFGAHTFDVGGRLISRDLLDSVSELNFLDRHIGIARRPGLTVLDIGAGYGRLAWRAVKGLDSVARYLCTDAIAPSTFICEYHLKQRGADDRARAIPLHEIERTLAEQPVDLAVNIHSFSECRLEAIGWWIALLKRHRVRHVMIVPNRVASDETTLLTNAGEDFSKILADNGYRLAVRERKYADSMVQKYGTNPATQFLFELG